MKSAPDRRIQAPMFTPEKIMTFPEQLQNKQKGFRETGGCHGAALFMDTGDLLLVREDVGRHNAVDKAIGAAAAAKVSLPTMGLFVSGRISFEIVQKAAMTGIGWIGGVSAPSSLAIDTAQTAGITLIGFCRGKRFTQFTSPTP